MKKDKRANIFINSELYDEFKKIVFSKGMTLTGWLQNEMRKVINRNNKQV